LSSLNSGESGTTGRLYEIFQSGSTSTSIDYGLAAFSDSEFTTEESEIGDKNSSWYKDIYHRYIGSKK
jgi:hypothetical protein